MIPELSPERWSQLSTLLDELLELDATAREERLARIAAERLEDAEVLRQLLEADAAGLTALDSTSPLLHPPTIRHAAGQDGYWLGRTVGGFQLARVLGRGGMGEVYLGERVSAGFTQRAAVKLLKRGMDSESIVRRFRRERRILARLSHPLIARFLDGGMTAEGQLWYAMEYVAGDPIDVYAQQHGLSIRQRIELLAQVCEAVGYAHSQLVVHRDLKPSNILIDQEGRPRLLDFGIAKLLDDPDDEVQTTDTRAMSPAYAAPEQMLGAAITVATDVYALGVVIYELLTGVRPQRCGQDSIEALLRAITTEPIERPSRVRAAQPVAEAGVRGGIDEELDTIVLKALKVAPAERYHGAAALGEDLKRYLEGRPLLASPDSVGYRIRAFVRRHRLGVAAAAIALSALVFGLGIALWQAERARFEAERAEQARQRAVELKDFTVSLLQNISPYTREGGRQLTAAQLLDGAAGRVEQELAADPIAQAELWLAIGRSLIELGELERGARWVELALPRLEQQVDQPTLTASALHLLAQAQLNQGDAAGARRRAEAALAVLAGGGEALRLERVRVRTTLLRVLNAEGAIAEALALGEQNLRERSALFGRDAAELAPDWNNLGSLYVLMDRYREAEHAYAEARRLLSAEPSTPPARWSWIRYGESLTAYGLGRYDEARAAVEEAVKLAVEHLGPHHAQTATVISGGAMIHRALGDYAAAERWLERVERSGQEAQTRALLDRQRVLLYADQGRWHEVEQLGAQLAEQPRSSGPSAYLVWLVRAMVARARAEAGRHAEAAAELKSILAEMERSGWAETGKSAEVRLALAEVWVASGRVDDGRRQAQVSLAEMSRVFGPEHVRTRFIARRVAAL